MPDEAAMASKVKGLVRFEAMPQGNLLADLLLNRPGGPFHREPTPDRWAELREQVKADAGRRAEIEGRMIEALATLNETMDRNIVELRLHTQALEANTAAIAKAWEIADAGESWKLPADTDPEQGQ